MKLIIKGIIITFLLFSYGEANNCISCHNYTEHAAEIKCIDCHRAATNNQGGIVHESEYIVVNVAPEVCIKCHKK